MAAMSIANELEIVTAALRGIFATTSSAEQRRAAHQVIEEFKETSSNCAEIGLSLYISNDNDETVRHIGLTFIEEYFKRKWNTINQEQHDNWKEKTLLLLKTADSAIPGHIKECIARLVVELVKREWPQNWERLLIELGEIQSTGAVQLEVVLLIFLRLAEDVMLFMDPHLQLQRKRNIEQGLSENMKNLFAFFLSTLQYQVQAWKSNKQPINRRLAEASLFTLAAYLGNIHLEHVFANDSLLLRMLCQLLGEKDLQLAAAQCLLAVVERRKDKIDARLPLLDLISEDAMRIYCEVARVSCLDSADENSYNFLKKLCDVLVALGTCQLTDIWGNDRGMSKRPDGFERYLKFILDFVNHPSQTICHKLALAYSAFLKHEQISKDNILIDSIPHFLTAFGAKLVKHGDPFEDNHPSCQFSAFDYESSEDFVFYFANLRSCLVNVLRECTLLRPIEGFQQVYKWIMNAKSKTTAHDATEWDALAAFADAVLGRFWKSEKLPENVDFYEEDGKSVYIASTANDLLQTLIQIESEALQVMVSVFGCMQAFFPFFKRSQTHLLASVEKIVLTFTRHPFNFVDKDIVQLRRQATACFVNLCKEDSNHLMPYFDDFRNYVDKLQQDKVLSSQELITIIEGLILLNNGMPDSKRQAYICDLLLILDRITIEDDFKRALETTENFIQYIGLTEEPAENALIVDNRFKLTIFIQLIQAIIRRAKLSEAEKTFIKTGGGFFESSSGCTWIVKMMSFLPVIIRLSRHLGMLWSPQITNLINNGFLEALQPNEKDKAHLLGQHFVKELIVAPSSSIILKTKNFLHNLLFSSYYLLGKLGGLFGEYFYKINSLSEMLINDVLQGPFFKPFVILCPASCYQNIIGPFLSVALKCMFKILSEEWSQFSGENYKGKIIDSTHVDDDNTTDAVIAERLMFSFSREYIEALVPSSQEHSPAEIGELGKFLLNCEDTSHLIITTLFTSLIWPDTASVNKVVRVIPFIVNYMNDRIIFDSKIDATVIDHLFTCILKREAYPSLVRIMLMVPSCKKDQLMKFDLDVFGGKCTLTEKKKREFFRKFLSDAFGKNISELYKSNIHIKNLPPMAPRKKIKQPTSIDDNPTGLTDLFGGN
eukprot:gene20435-22450_t